jgi:hypothetical protein
MPHDESFDNVSLPPQWGCFSGVRLAFGVVLFSVVLFTPWEGKNRFPHTTHWAQTWVQQVIHARCH